MNRKEMLLAAGVGTLASCTKTATGLVVPSSRGGIAPASGSDPSGLFYQVKDWRLVRTAHWQIRHYGPHGRVLQGRHGRRR